MLYSPEIVWFVFTKTKLYFLTNIDVIHKHQTVTVYWYGVLNADYLLYHGAVYWYCVLQVLLGVL